MPDNESRDPNKVAIAMELTTDILVGILRRRARAKELDFGQLLAEAAQHSQNADEILDQMEAKDRGDEPEDDS